MSAAADADTPIEFQGRFTLEDHLRATRPGRLRFWLGGALPTLTVSAVVFWAIAVQLANWRLGLLIWLTFLFGLGLVYYRSVQRSRRAAIERDVSGLAGPGGIHEESGPIETIIRWEAFTDFDVYDGKEPYIVLSRSATMAEYYTRRWFASDDQWEQFLQLVERHVREPRPA